MTTLTVNDFIKRVSEALETVKNGDTVQITADKNGVPMAVLAPPPQTQANPSHKLGLYEGKVKVVIHEDWEMTDEEFLKS
ncbi:MAG: hypothetical protein HY360_07310 [Verrucomicrobia bacterium]|nr:hypothetical protein [Verrucomicrobiota bacterium]